VRRNRKLKLKKSHTAMPRAACVFGPVAFIVLI
jgi:hypothetical protein